MQNDSTIILQSLTAQVSCYRRLAKLADVQHHHVQQSQTEELLGVLHKRQEVINRITSLEQVIAPVRKNWSTFLNSLDTEQRASAEKLMAETKTLLEEVMSADRNDTIVLQQRKIDVVQQIRQAGKGQQANRRYAAAAYGAAIRSTVDVRST